MNLRNYEVCVILNTRSICVCNSLYLHDKKRLKYQFKRNNIKWNVEILYWLTANGFVLFITFKFLYHSFELKLKYTHTHTLIHDHTDLFVCLIFYVLSVYMSMWFVMSFLLQNYKIVDKFHWFYYYFFSSYFSLFYLHLICVNLSK